MQYGSVTIRCVCYYELLLELLLLSCVFGFGLFFLDPMVYRKQSPYLRDRGKVCLYSTFPLPRPHFMRLHKVCFLLSLFWDVAKCFTPFHCYDRHIKLALQSTLIFFSFSIRSITYESNLTS